MNETMPSCWIDEVEDELVRELLDDESPLFILPEERLEPNLSPDQSMDPLVSNLYSGTMILGLEDALSSVTAQKYQNHAAYSQSRLPIWERNLSKMEDNKYTLRLKCCGGNRMADDGYKWRKYGQKSIKNSPYPRSYYRCTNPQCCAKKQVERSREDEDIFIITYEGLHLHFAYPYFLPKEPPPEPEPEPDQQTKRAKSSIAESEPQAPPPEQAQQFTSWTSNGLLEDVVPFMVRNPNPSSSSSNNTYSSSSCSSYRSSSGSPSSLSWSPTLY